MSRGRTPRKPDSTVRALLRHHGHDGDPATLVRKLTTMLLTDMLGGPPTPADLPIDLRMAASFLGAVIETGPGGPSGSIRYDGRRYVIRLSSDESAARQQFTGGHEITHIPFLIATGATERTDDGPVGRFEWSRQEEYLCDLGGSELVMPASAIGALISEQPTMADAERVAAACGTSIEAAARRVVDLSDLPGCVVVLAESLKPSEVAKSGTARKSPSLFPDLDAPDPTPKLRVKYAVGDGLYVPKSKSVSEGCRLVDVLKGDGVEFVGHTGLVDEPIAVSARYMPYRDRTTKRLVPRVVAIAFRADEWTEASRRRIDARVG